MFSTSKLSQIMEVTSKIKEHGQELMVQNKEIEQLRTFQI